MHRHKQRQVMESTNTQMTSKNNIQTNYYKNQTCTQLVRIDNKIKIRNSDSEL